MAFAGQIFSLRSRSRCRCETSTPCMDRLVWLQRETDTPIIERYDVESLISGILLQAANSCDVVGARNRATVLFRCDVCATHGCPAVKDVTHLHLHSSVCQSETIHTRSPEVAVSTLIPQKEMLWTRQPRFVGSLDCRESISVHFWREVPVPASSHAETRVQPPFCYSNHSPWMFRLRELEWTSNDSRIGVLRASESENSGCSPIDFKIFVIRKELYWYLNQGTN